MEAKYERKGDELIEIVRVDIIKRSGEPIKGSYREMKTHYPTKDDVETQLEELKNDLEGVKNSIAMEERAKPKKPLAKDFVEKVRAALQRIEFENKYAAKLEENLKVKAEIEHRIKEIKRIYPDL